MLVNVRLQIMFRPELIDIFDLIVNLTRQLKIDIWVLKKIVTQPKYYLNYITPRPDAALTKPANRKNTRKKQMTK